MLCSVEEGAQHRARKGSFRMDLSTKFGKEIPSRNLRKKGQLRLKALIDSVSVRFKNAHVEKMPLNIHMQWNACVSECVLKALACRGLRVSPSKSRTKFSYVIADADTDTIAAKIITRNLYMKITFRGN